MAPQKSHEQQLQEALGTLESLNSVYGRDGVVKSALKIIEAHMGYWMKPSGHYLFADEKPAKP